MLYSKAKTETGEFRILGTVIIMKAISVCAKRLLILAAAAVVTLMLTSCGKTESDSKKIETLDDLKGCTFAISDSNSSYEESIESELPGAKFDRYTNYFDTFIAVANGNADTAFCFKYTFIGLKESYPNLEYVESNITIPIVADFSKKSDDLKKDFNRFIKESKQNGLLDELAEKWMYGYDELTDKDIVDFSDLDGTNGSFKYALSNENIPYEYLRNGKITGFEPALVYEFCKARGYKPVVTETQFDAVVAGVSAGKYDMGTGGYGYTDERSENSNFSEPFFNDVVVYTVNSGASSVGIIDKDSFRRTFIAQNRWKLYGEGMIVTMLITVLSVTLGAAVGFALFLCSRHRKWLEKLSYSINSTLEALPVLVVLMIFFYIIFGSTDISGIVVSVLVFGMCFAFSFFAMMSNSVNVVPAEQTEAGLALGYTNTQTLFKVVLPQAMETFIPSVRSAIVATLKSTAIVGYVAVQDLTKAGDLVRSQTFEAFLPIITVAVLYFALAKGLIFLLNKLLVTPGERRRMRKEGK